MSIADQSCAQAVQKSKKHTTVKEIIKRCRRTNLCTAFSIQINKVRPAKSDSDFAAVERSSQL